ncbi:MAG: CDP-alcohol phosphatidyltransferase family protein [Actinomycetota bacterium]|nr:hypothetical protein [Actinomycetota bacterium]
MTRARDLLIRLGVKADSITATALLLSVAGALCFMFAGWLRWLLLLVPFLAMGRITLNALDGMVAVADGSARPYGEVLNETCDRLSDVVWFIGLGSVTFFRPAAAALAMVLLSSYIGTVAKAAGGSRIYAGVMGKADRMIVVSIASASAYFVGERALKAGVWVILAGSAVTAIQRLFISRRMLDAS